jgi:RHS repeat-associated protein
VTDFNGMLAAQVGPTGTTLELPDLHGDIMAIATTSATATGPTATYVYTEFGTPENGSPGTYGWLGGDQISSNALGGQLLMGARAYNSNTGRFSQVDPIPGGSANAYDYGAQNPATHFDTSGLYWVWIGFNSGSTGWVTWAPSGSILNWIFNVIGLGVVASFFGFTVNQPYARVDHFIGFYRWYNNSTHKPTNKYKTVAIWIQHWKLHWAVETFWFTIWQGEWEWSQYLSETKIAYGKPWNGYITPDPQPNPSA